MKAKLFYLALLTALITSVGQAEDPDYGNIPDDATAIPTDGTIISGYLDSGDVDWFKFTPAANTLYRVTMTGEINQGYKEMDIDQADEFGNLTRTIYHYTWSNGTSVRTFFLEKADDIYIKLYSAAGGYSFFIEILGSYPPDSYADSCSEATPITVDASPLSGTLTHNPDDSLETDWFVFETEPMHMYQITMTKSDNTDLYFQVYNDNCELILDSERSRTVTSWFGESYIIRAFGNPDYLGTYYTLEVVDLGLYPDDSSNVSQAAQPITPDGTIIEGQIEYNASYHSDVDWYTFTPAANTLYRVTMNGEINKNYKEMDVYQIDEFGNLTRTIYHYVWSNGTSVRTFFLEKADDIYIKLYSSPGNYSFYVETVGYYPPDSYADSCIEATPITVDASPLSGTLTHNPDGSLEKDWFVFETEPMHMYQIMMTKCDNTDLYFQVYNDNCELVLDSDRNRTVTSWFGEPYIISAHGYAANLGTYYTLEVIDLGLCMDDYPNIADDAVTIPKDGTVVEGEIQYLSSYHSDEDWLTFIAGQAGNYNFMFGGELNKSYKELVIYWKDELGVLRNYKYAYVWSDGTSNFSVALPAGQIYVKLYSNLGKYYFYVVSPEPRCGDLDHPYPPGDANQDCYVNLEDLSLMAANWLSCTDPTPPCND